MAANVKPRGREGVVYLNTSGEGSDFYSKLLEAFDGLPRKLQRAPIKNWLDTIRGLTQKGVKGREMEEMRVLEAVDALLSGRGKSIDREDVRNILEDRVVTLKEITRSGDDVKYRAYSHAAPGDEYKEAFVVMNSPRDNVIDRCDELDWELDQLNFDIQALSRDPQQVFRLIDEKKRLEELLPMTRDFTQHHFSNDKSLDLKNLVFHARYTISNGIFFVDEIQSDWAQRGRRSGFGADFPKAPFIQDTNSWTQLAMHRLMQVAARRDDVREFAWVRGHMRNGGRSVVGDGLDKFYTGAVLSIVKKRLGDAGSVSLRNIQMRSGVKEGVYGVSMTDAVREKMSQPSPLYSLTRLRRPNEPAMDMQGVAQLSQMAEMMLGSVRHLMCLRSITSMDTLQQVAGDYLNGLVRVNMNARNPVFVFNHEAFHFAQEKFITVGEQRHLDAMFAPGTRLNAQVRHLLLQFNDRAAAGQCDNTREAQAHGFALWAQGRLSGEGLLERPQQSFLSRLFREVKSVLQDMGLWVHAVARQEQQRDEQVSVMDVFRKLQGGEYARQAQDMAERGESLSRSGAMHGVTRGVTMGG